LTFDIKSGTIWSMAQRRRPVEDWLGATQPKGSVAIVLFVPSCDREGNAIDHDLWVTRSREVLGQLFRGATAYPRARGVWRDDERSGELKFDEPTVVTCYAARTLLEEPEVQTALRAFLHRLGRETRQGEVGIVVEGTYYGITDFD
jgi:hypothetical protein